LSTAFQAEPTRSTAASPGFVIPSAARNLQFLEQGVPGKTTQNLAWRWIKFNVVGGIGIVVQLAALWVLTHTLRSNYLIATALAVETAVLHNFLWHQRFTWADRNQDRWHDAVVRLLHFNLSNGLVSIAGNLLLMRALVGGLHLRLLLANLLSIAACSAANFALSEMYVFRAKAISPRRHGDTEEIVGIA
jgi:putative flippase GtrA